MVSLLILVTGNRHLEALALRPRLHWSSSVTRRGSSGPCFRREHPERWHILVLAPRGCTVHRAWGRQDGRTGPAPTGAGHQSCPRCCQCARCFLFLCFLSFFILAHLEQNHCISSGGAAINPTQGQWYQSSQPSQPIIGLPSSGLLHPGQIQI